MSLLGDEYDIDDAFDAHLSGESKSALTFETPKQQNQLIGHGNQKDLFLKLFNAGKMPHGWIFSGTKGIGKETTAFLAAKHILSSVDDGDASAGLFGDVAEVKPASDFSFDPEASIIKRIESGGHGDLLFIEPDEEGKTEIINVVTARKVVQFLQKTSSEGGWRVVIINDADKMNNAAQNALLKILEEPPEKTVLILITTAIARLLPTIRSRCRLLPFNELEPSDMRSLISESHILDDHDLSVEDAISFSKGSFGALQEFIGGGSRQVFQTLIDALVDAPALDRQKLIDTSHKIIANKKGKDFSNFMRLWTWWIENLIKDFSDVCAYHPILDEEIGIIKTLRVQDDVVEKLIGLWDNLNELRIQSNWANHDKQTVILETYYLFESIFKK